MLGTGRTDAFGLVAGTAALAPLSHSAYGSFLGFCARTGPIGKVGKGSRPVGRGLPAYGWREAKCAAISGPRSNRNPLDLVKRDLIASPCDRGSSAVDPALDQRHHQLVENRREIRRRNQRTHIRHAKLGSRPIVDGQVRLPVQARRIGNAVRRGRVLMESQRPGSPQSLRRRTRDIARNAHPDGAIAAKIDERKRRGDFDLNVTPNVELALIHGIIADRAVAAIA